MNGFIQARRITKQHAKTFYFASRFLKKEKRNAAYAVYAICRIVDEVVDNTESSPSEQNLKKLEKNITAVYDQTSLDNAILLALRQTVEKYKIPEKYFRELISGMYMDLYKSRYKNFSELLDYCYKVAGVVGLIMLQIFGYKDPKAKYYAVDLGIAMQLTNILRDIKEDFDRGRIYLPEDDMMRFGLTENDIAQGRISDNFKKLLKFYIARAREYYTNSKLGIKMIDDINSRFVICAMADIYSGILKAIEKNNYDIFSRRAHVGILDKIKAILKIILKGEYR